MRQLPFWVKAAILTVLLLLGIFLLFVMCSTLMISGGMSHLIEGQRRVKVAQVSSTQRRILLAVEEFYKDNKTLPDNLMALTTPVAYIRSAEAQNNFIDVFAKNPTYFSYFTLENSFLIGSVGPDQQPDIKSAQDLAGGLPRLQLKTYDATNGSVSSGDLYRFKSFGPNAP